MELKKKLGMTYGDITPLKSKKDKLKYINFKLAALGQPLYNSEEDDKKPYFIELFEDVINDYKEKSRLLSDSPVPADRRIQDFLDDYLKDVEVTLKPELPKQTFILDQHGLARELSLPPHEDKFENSFVKSYRIKQGILNNPKHDRRTTKGSFHIVEGTIPVPFDKKEVPKNVFANLLNAAVQSTDELLTLPFTSTQKEKAKLFISLLLRPIVSPEVPGIVPEKTMELRFFAPGCLVSNLDFVESIFGNAGDPNLHINDAALDIEHWSGHTGCVILAPNLITLKKKDLGLPHYNDATERQKIDGMCYKDENELYNDGSAFKLTCRDERGVVVTLIGDNYYGYSKKEVKTQLSYAANLFGLAEEEHAGGTIAFSRKNLGENFFAGEVVPAGFTFEDIKKNYSYLMDVMPQNYGVDLTYEDVIYVPENTNVDLHNARISWSYKGKDETLKLLPNKRYILPNGYKFHIEKHPATPAWKLIGTEPEGTFCHKPCTVSGGGKSEISKSVANSIIYGTYFVHDAEKDFDKVEEIIGRDYKGRWNVDPARTRPSRHILSPERSLGSVIKLLTPSSDYTDDFNQWLSTIPNYIKSLVFMVKRFYLPEWGGNWRQHFSVDTVNGKPGNELNFNNRKVKPSYLRVGMEQDGAWRIFKLRMDFMAAEKIQMEDDISASVVMPASHIKYLNPEYKNPSVKFSVNCESRFFQRPDEAIVRGYDKEAEADLCGANTFITNYEPLDKDDIKEVIEDAMNLSQYTQPVKDLIDDFYHDAKQKYVILPSHPRMVDGKPTKNPRYQQVRADFIEPSKIYIAEIGTRLARKVPKECDVPMPVNAVLPGRRNNPPGEEGGVRVRPLSVYSPIHYQELPELTMDFISSLTGKSPSTTGAGSEGALTKGPFNMLPPTIDLNSAVLSFILTGYSGYSTPAGYIGVTNRFDHDISMLIPELWTRLSAKEREPEKLIKEGCLEKIEDFEYEGETIEASRLGYRVTEKFMYSYMGRIFDEPQTIFTANMLRPEKESLSDFVDGVKNICESQKKVALTYIADGSVDFAIPPLKALIYIMANGDYEGKVITDKEIRDLFSRENVINSDWYKERLVNKQKIDVKLMTDKVAYLKGFMSNKLNETVVDKFPYAEKLKKAEKELEYFKSPLYLEHLIGTLGADDLYLRK